MNNPDNCTCRSCAYATLIIVGSSEYNQHECNVYGCDTDSNGYCDDYKEVEE